METQYGYCDAKIRNMGLTTVDWNRENFAGDATEPRYNISNMNQFRHRLFHSPPNTKNTQKGSNIILIREPTKNCGTTYKIETI